MAVGCLAGLAAGGLHIRGWLGFIGFAVCDMLVVRVALNRYAAETELERGFGEVVQEGFAPGLAVFMMAWTCVHTALTVLN